MMLFSDLELSKRLERAEGFACVQFAEARRRLFPDSGAEWIECGGAYAIFDSSESQHNAERKGFRIAYTRTKWRFASTDPSGHAR